MRVILQRCLDASVSVNNKEISKINKGCVLLVGFCNDDTPLVVEKMAKKISNLRIYDDENGKMNLSIHDIAGQIISVSQFTLYAKLKSRRPSFTDALSYDESLKLYNLFNQLLKNDNIVLKAGIFGEDMKVKLVNDGPVTIILDSKEI